jgi:60 kDa SS-A/Ro ribonucleoprotein
MRYLRTIAVQVGSPVPQSKPLPNQVPNSAGGFSFALDKWKRLDRFLILGSEGGSYYAGERKLTEENAKCLAECLKEDGEETVARIQRISIDGRAPKNDPALFALAYAAAKGDDATRAAAFDSLIHVARIGTHLFHFAAFANAMRGWGRGLRTAVGNWYKEQDAEGTLADQVTKYQQRDGWSHRDLLRLSHLKPNTRTLQSTVKWVVKGELNKTAPERIAAHLELQAATKPKQAAKLIRKYGLVRESVPTELLKSPEVWEALLDKMPMTAMIRNLGNLSKCGLLAPLSDASKLVVQRLGDEDILKKARIHPVQLLIAQKTYGAGRGNKGKGEWLPVPQVVDALNEAFYASFLNIQPSGKRFYLGLDVSGSMSTGSVAGVDGFTPREASAAMSMVTARSEKEYYVAGFQDRLIKINISPYSRLDDICQTTARLSFGMTDCAQPMLDALQRNIKADVFVIYTDSETNIGGIHPAKALEQYRQHTGIPAKLIVVGMTANGFTIADPNDEGMLDIVGFDTAAPQVISQFASA